MSTYACTYIAARTLFSCALTDKIDICGLLNAHLLALWVKLIRVPKCSDEKFNYFTPTYVVILILNDVSELLCVCVCVSVRKR